MTVSEMIDVLDEFKTILPQLSGQNKTLVEMRIDYLQTQLDEYTMYIDQLAEMEENRVHML